MYPVKKIYIGQNDPAFNDKAGSFSAYRIFVVNFAR
jgi:hypothetical protein